VSDKICLIATWTRNALKVGTSCCGKIFITSKNNLTKPSTFYVLFAANKSLSQTCLVLPYPKNKCHSFSKFVSQWGQLYWHGTPLFCNRSRVGRQNHPTCSRWSPPTCSYDRTEFFTLHYRWGNSSRTGGRTSPYIYIYMCAFIIEFCKG